MSDLDDLYQQFIEIHQQNHNLEPPEEALEKANEFEALTDGHFQVLMNFRSKRSLTEDDSSTCKRLEVMLSEERNTWRLVKALLKDHLLTNDPSSASVNGSLNVSQNGYGSHDSTRMDYSNEINQNGHDNNIMMDDENACFSEDQLIGNYYVSNPEIRRMQVIVDWLEANEAGDLAYRDEEDKAEFHAEGPTAWENTFHAMRAKYNTEIIDLDITVNPNAGLELCPSMDPDGPLRTKKSLAHQDKEVEIRLFKHLLRFIRAGKLDEGQELAQRVGYFWLSAFLEGWLPFSDPNLDQENLGAAAIHQAEEIRPVTGNKKRDVWKRTCFMAARTPGLNSCEKAILGVLGGNLKSVLPSCHSWADQLWARIRCSIDVKIERALRDPNVVPQENRTLIELPQEFYDNYQNLETIFKSIHDQKIVSPYKEATIQQTIQKYFILNDMNGLMNQLDEWCVKLDYDHCAGSVSPHFLRCFTHIVLFLREIGLIGEDDVRATRIIEAYIALLTKQKSPESVAYYSSQLPKDNQTMSFAKMLASVIDREEKKHCLKIAKECKLDVDEITQTVVRLIREETPEAAVSAAGSFILPPSSSLNNSIGKSSQADSYPKTTPFDKRKIDALDYLLLLDIKNYIAILHHGNSLLRLFALERKMDAVKETFSVLPKGLGESVETQWRVHTNSDIPQTLRNNLRELEAFKVLLKAQEELGQWSDWHHKRPKEPLKPANLSKFCDNVNYEKNLKQYQHDLNGWREFREVKTNELMEKMSLMLKFPHGWMRDITAKVAVNEFSNGLMNQASGIDMTNTTNTNNQGPDLSAVEGEHRTDRQKELTKLRRHFVPHMISICFNILQLTTRYEDCLKLAHLLADDELRLYDEFSKSQLRDFLDKIAEVTKLLVKQSLLEEAAASVAH